MNICLRLWYIVASGLNYVSEKELLGLLTFSEAKSAMLILIVVLSNFKSVLVMI